MYWIGVKGYVEETGDSVKLACILTVNYDYVNFIPVNLLQPFVC